MAAQAVTALIALIVLVAGPSVQAQVPLSCTVIMYNSFDYTSDKCVNAVANARTYCGGKRINFIPTLFWWDSDADPKTFPKVEKYCAESGGGCNEMNSGSIATFQNAMARCFKKAVDLGFTEIDIAPHLDDARYLHWRAQLNFQPRKKYGSWSYEDIMLKPLANALNTVLSKNIKINFAMVGEMSGTIFRSAADWIPVLQAARGMVTQKNKAKFGKNVKIGVSVNWDKLCGCHNLGEVDPEKWLNDPKNGFKKVFKKYERRGTYKSKDVQALFRNIDFIGISYYPHKVFDLTPQAFSNSAQLFDEELSLFGVSITQFVASGKQLRLHEFGMGGGVNGHTTKATRLSDLLRYPFFGVGGGYNKDNDPFELWRPANEQSEPRLLIRKFYREALKWFSTGGGPKYRFSAVFLWNSGSWDITGVNPDSTNWAGSWRDPFTQNMIKQYNDRGTVPK